MAISPKARRAQVPRPVTISGNERNVTVTGIGAEGPDTYVRPIPGGSPDVQVPQGAFRRSRDLGYPGMDHEYGIQPPFNNALYPLGGWYAQELRRRFVDGPMAQGQNRAVGSLPSTVDYDAWPVQTPMRMLHLRDRQMMGTVSPIGFTDPAAGPRTGRWDNSGRPTPIQGLWDDAGNQIYEPPAPPHGAVTNVPWPQATSAANRSARPTQTRPVQSYISNNPPPGGSLSARTATLGSGPQVARVPRSASRRGSKRR